MKPRPVRQTDSTPEIRKCKMKQTSDEHSSSATVKWSTVPSAGGSLDHREAQPLTQPPEKSSGNTQHREDIFPTLEQTRENSKGVVRAYSSRPGGWEAGKGSPDPCAASPGASRHSQHWELDTSVGPSSGRAPLAAVRVQKELLHLRDIPKLGLLTHDVISRMLKDRGRKEHQTQVAQTDAG